MRQILLDPDIDNISQFRRCEMQHSALTQYLIRPNRTEWIPLSLFQVAQPHPVAADPGDAGSHGGQVEEEGGGAGERRVGGGCGGYKNNNLLMFNYN